MLEFKQLALQFSPIRHYFLAFGMLFILIAKPVSPQVDVGLEVKSDLSFVLLHDQLRADQSKEIGCAYTPQHPSINSSMLWVWSRVDENIPAKFLADSFDDRSVTHTYPKREVESVVDRTLLLGSVFADCHPTLTIKHSGDVLKTQHVLPPSVTDRMLANSGDTPCPARKGAEGQSRTKQAATQPGVRNEHVPTPKGKMCSELGRNAERSAEMTGPVDVAIHYNIRPLVTDCNSNYIYFYVDPNMFFTWTEPRSWPNQLTKTRLVTLRLALVYKARMFHAVLDGWTA